MFSIAKRTLPVLDPFFLGSARYCIGVLLVVTKGNLSHVFEGGSLVGDLLVFLGAASWVTCLSV